MSIQTAIPLTPEQAQAQSVLARRRALINQKAASIQVTVLRNGKPVSVFLNTLPPVERAKAIQNLLAGPELLPVAPTAGGSVAAAAPAIAAPAEAKASRFTTRTKRTTASATKKATKKK